VRVVFAVLAVVSLALGYWGLLRYAEASPAYGTGWDDLLYWDLQLFVLDSSPAQDGGAIPWMLQVARFGAPLATAYALASTAQAIFGRQLAQLRARRARGHSIVCGTEPAAEVLTRELLAAGERVIVIDRGTEQVGQPAEPPDGAHLVIGDARVEDVLRRAGVTGARDVMAVTSDSAFNAEVGLVVSALASDEGISVACHAEIADRQLCAAMSAAAPRRGDGAGTLHFFSRHDRAARDLIEHSPLVGTDPARASALIAGGGHLAQAVLSEIARLWDQRSRRGGAALPVTVLDPTGDLDRQLVRTPLPPGAVDLTVEAVDPLSLTTVEQLHVAKGPAAVAGDDDASAGRRPGRPPAYVFVCLDDDTAALRVGLTAVDLLADAQVVVAVTSGTVFGQLLGGRPPGTSSGDRPQRLILHNVIRTVYASRSVRRDLVEEMARAAHSAYVAAALARGETPEENPSIVPWDELSGDLRHANLTQAADVERKLDAIGCAVTSTPTLTGEPFAFTDAEVDQLAELEHERWMDERRDRGWTPGPRDTAAKVHPDLVDWAELPDQSREKDRDAVREIPQQLRSAGLGIARRPPPAP